MSKHGRRKWSFVAGFSRLVLDQHLYSARCPLGWFRSWGHPTARQATREAVECCISMCQEERWNVLCDLTVVQLLSFVQPFLTPQTAARQASLTFTVSWSLLKLMSIESMRPSNHLILCCPLLLPLFFPSIWVFSSELVLLIKWPKFWSFSFSISPSNEYSRLISFRIDWFDLLAVQRTLKNLLQHHSLKVSILRC